MVVRGTAEAGSWVTVYHAGTAVGTVVAGVNGAFAVTVTLTAGDNVITAVARNRNPQPGATSAPLHLVYDNSIPGTPVALVAKSRAAGKVELTWQSPTSGAVSGYYLFRSGSPISDQTAFAPDDALGGLLRSTAYTDLPDADGRYYYCVVAVHLVDESPTLGAPSASAEGISDRTPPTGMVAVRALGSKYAAAANRYGPGLVEVTVTTSESLLAAPFVSLAIAQGAPLVPSLAPFGDNVYTGTVAITGKSGSGVVTPTFSALDQAGNRGTSATLLAPVTIDTTGPVVVGLTPLRLTDAGIWEDLTSLETVKNAPVAPATTVTLAWRVQLDEPSKAGLPPTLTATLSAHAGHIHPLRDRLKGTRRDS